MRGLGVVCCQQDLCSVLWVTGQYAPTSSMLLILCGHCAVYYSQIKKIESHVIEGHEEYSMVAFHLNAEGMLVAHRQCWCMSLSWQLQNILTAAVCLRQRQVLAVLVP